MQPVRWRRCALLAMALLACSSSEDGAERLAERASKTASALSIGAPAPEYRTVSIDGDSVSLAQQRGKVVLLNIWATWCHPCRDELPVLQRLHERNAPRGLELIGVSVDARGEEQKVREFAASFGLTYPLWLDPEERVSRLFLAIGVPATYLISRDGTLLWRHVGPIREGDRSLARALETALRSPSS
ncbi:MAG TPA: TlpA disulfide reductase family protein [Gemmatimonadaceae bacterium]|nr:TlpA disulfide reductase family protein [Gemmatimonadaceae bacterium]